MTFKSFSALPPGGWKLTIPQLGDNGTAPFGLTFEEAAAWGKNKSLANPRFGLPTDTQSWAEQVVLQTALDLKSRFPTSYQNWVIEDATPPKAQAWLQARQPELSPPSVGSVAAVKSGVGVLLSWLGAGLEPVNRGTAESRAITCAKCPQNVKGDWLHFFSGPVAALLKQQMSIKAEMNLETSKDSVLGVCGACKCELNLKAWVPLKHVTENTTIEVAAKLDPDCWVLNEA